MSAVRIARGALTIPIRIERGPTDILKALASTVKHIPKEPEYSLQDDPFLLPRKPNERRLFILSKFSGIRTAKFLLNKHPELFFRDDAEPKIEAFLPAEEFNSEMQFTEEDLKWCIENNDPVNGIIAFKSIEEKQIELSDSTLLDFFELLCYTNEEKLPDSIEHEMSKFLPDSEEQLVNQTWKTSGLVSKIFNKIKQDLDPPRVYSSMIAGLVAYNEHATAKQVFDDFRENHSDSGLYTAAYDSLLRSIPRLNSSVSTANEALDEIVKHMESHLVKPDLLVFNSILKCYRDFTCDDVTCQNAFRLINDMKSLNIEPSLFTFSCLIGIINRNKGGNVYGSLILDILGYIERNETVLTIRDDRDKSFLGAVMNSFAIQMNDLRMCNRLHKIYLKNPRLFSNQRFRTRYLNNYFKLIVTTDSLDNILNFYDSYVPMVFLPSPDCYEALAEVLDLYKAPEDVVKKIGKDIVDFKLTQKIKNDAIFRKDKEYVDALENSI